MASGESVRRLPVMAMVDPPNGGRENRRLAFRILLTDGATPAI
jgi:hypothetical protein